MSAVIGQRVDARSKQHPVYWAFLLHRLSGLALALFLPLHFTLLAQALNGAAAFDAAHGSNFERVPALETLIKAQVDKPESLVEGNDLRLWTHRHGTDGFFASIWQRR